ncbi:MAG TPA: type II CAAX endopeptidase family protein [Candidatus Limnocylindria bacterium]|nr:type II CAAX endopeptidase family protein [Candidatus Limnocylindria bacterium]
MDEPRPEALWNAEPPQPSADDPLRRLRALQVISVLMILAGIILPIVALASAPDLLSETQTPESVRRVLGPVLMLALGGLLFVLGLVLNAARALIVRGSLAPERYRGPAVLVLLVMAVILGTVVAALGAGGTVLALFDGGELTVGGSLLLLTSTQIGLLAVTGGFVVLPRALVGVRIVGRTGLGRSLLIGFGAAIPAWIGATLLGALAAVGLEAIGLKEEAGALDAFLERGDPTVILVAFLLVAPVAEEVFFRGVAYNAWERERGPWVAVLGSAVLFAAIHGSLFALVPIFALGVTLALLYRQTRSLAATIAMHAGFNAISVAIALLVRQGILTLPT